MRSIDCRQALVPVRTFATLHTKVNCYAIACTDGEVTMKQGTLLVQSEKVRKCIGVRISAVTDWFWPFKAVSTRYMLSAVMRKEINELRFQRPTRYLSRDGTLAAAFRTGA
jgi:hypothetical protein